VQRTRHPSRVGEDAPRVLFYKDDFYSSSAAAQSLLQSLSFGCDSIYIIAPHQLDMKKK
jgi:hypothetical protein